MNERHIAGPSSDRPATVTAAQIDPGRSACHEVEALALAARRAITPN
jgi:hypothetical protein